MYMYLNLHYQMYNLIVRKSWKRWNINFTECSIRKGKQIFNEILSNNETVTKVPMKLTNILITYMYMNKIRTKGFCLGTLVIQKRNYVTHKHPTSIHTSTITIFVTSKALVFVESNFHNYTNSFLHNMYTIYCTLNIHIKYTIKYCKVFRQL